MRDKPDTTSGEDAAKRLISLAEAATLSGLSQDHLRRLVGGGLIWGTKIGRNWVTTAEAVKAYLDSDRRPGPKSKE